MSTHCVPSSVLVLRNHTCKQDTVRVLEKLTVFYAMHTCKQTVKIQSGAFLHQFSGEGKV